MSPETWVNDHSPASAVVSGSIDGYCNLATLLLAHIINLTAGKSQVEHSGAPMKVQALWFDLHQ